MQNKEQLLEYVYRPRRKADSTLIRISNSGKTDLETIGNTWGMSRIAAMDYLLRLAALGEIPRPLSVGTPPAAPDA